MTNYTIKKLPDTHKRKNWKIVFSSEPQEGEVQTIIQSNYPVEGYGQSVYSQALIEGGFWVVFVTSNDSCD